MGVMMAKFGLGDIYCSTATTPMMALDALIDVFMCGRGRITSA